MNPSEAGAALVVSAGQNVSTRKDAGAKAPSAAASTSSTSMGGAEQATCRP